MNKNNSHHIISKRKNKNYKDNYYYKGYKNKNKNNKINKIKINNNNK